MMSRSQGDNCTGTNGRSDQDSSKPPSSESTSGSPPNVSSASSRAQQLTEQAYHVMGAASLVVDAPWQGRLLTNQDLACLVGSMNKKSVV